MGTVSGMQKCGKCGRDKVGVNETQKCLVCEAEPGTSTLRVTCEDPGDEKMKQVLAAAGVVVPIVSNASGAKLQVKAAAPAPAIPNDIRSIRDAIYRLPMPKSIKQYKRFQKIQALIDEVLAEETQ